MKVASDACTTAGNIGYPFEEGDKSLTIDLACDASFISAVTLSNKLAAGIDRSESVEKVFSMLHADL